jgi:CHAT domain-containing protein
LLTVDDRLLIERAAISYTPTVATLLRPSPPASAWAPPWQLQLRAFGDPAFTSAGFDDPGDVRKRLAESAREVQSVASELGGAEQIYLGAENRKSHLFDSRERAPVLHLATHASADPIVMERSRILFSPPPGSRAGADYLFLREAYDLRLTGVELAVLSACDTERGPMLNGEGVQSFSRAFLAAGARSTVTTLWRVADSPTADFMKIFYHHLQRGVPRDEALRRAKLRFLEADSTLAHPHFWAAFVLTGDGLRPIPRAMTWRFALACAAAIMLLPFAAVVIVRKRRPPRRHTAETATI